MKILIAAAVVSFGLVAPALAMPMAPPSTSALSEQAIVQVQYPHYRGGYEGRRPGWGPRRHYGWGHGYRHYRRY